MQLLGGHLGLCTQSLVRPVPDGGYSAVAVLVFKDTGVDMRHDRDTPYTNSQLRNLICNGRHFRETGDHAAEHDSACGDEPSKNREKPIDVLNRATTIDILAWVDEWKAQIGLRFTRAFVRVSQGGTW